MIGKPRPRIHRERRAGSPDTSIATIPLKKPACAKQLTRQFFLDLSPTAERELHIR
jgi:hypothetical protein